MVMKGQIAGKICHQYSSVITAIIPFSRTIKLQYTLLGDYWECVGPARLPVLNRVPSSVPPGNNIQDMFLIGSATDTTSSLPFLNISPSTTLDTQHFLQLFTVTSGQIHCHATVMIHTNSYIFISWFINLLEPIKKIHSFCVCSLVSLSSLLILRI